MKFLIPSKLRLKKAKQVLEIFGLERSLVYVHESEREDYKQLSDNLRTHKEIGMGAIRKFMLEQNRSEDYLFMVDDDVTGMEYKFADRMVRIPNGYHCREIIQNAYQVAYDLETPLFGFVSSPNPYLYTQMDHCHFNGMIACGIGIIPEFLGSINFDPRLLVNEDQDFCLQTKYYKRFFFMDNRYNFRYGRTWVAKGGCSTLRTNDVMLQCRNILRSKFGSSVVVQSGKKENQHVLRVEF